MLTITNLRQLFNLFQYWYKFYMRLKLDNRKLIMKYHKARYNTIELIYI